MAAGWFALGRLLETTRIWRFEKQSKGNQRNKKYRRFLDLQRAAEQRDTTLSCARDVLKNNQVKSRESKRRASMQRTWHPSPLVGEGCSASAVNSSIAGEGFSSIDPSPVLGQLMLRDLHPSPAREFTACGEASEGIACPFGLQPLCAFAPAARWQESGRCNVRNSLIKIFS